MIRYLFSHGRATPVGLVLLAVVLVVGLLLLTRFARRIRRDPSVDVRSATGPRRGAADWAAEAARHAAAGEWREALRCRYRALVADLAVRGVVEEIPGRTAREYTAQVRDHLPPAGVAFGEASDLFEAAWYGNQPSTQAEHERITDLADGVLAQAGRR